MNHPPGFSTTTFHAETQEVSGMPAPIIRETPRSLALSSHRAAQRPYEDQRLLSLPNSGLVMGGAHLWGNRKLQGQELVPITYLRRRGEFCLPVGTSTVSLDPGLEELLRGC